MLRHILLDSGYDSEGEEHAWLNNYCLRRNLAQASWEKRVVSKQHVKLAIGVLVIVVSIAYLMFSGATGSTMYFLTVPEVQQRLTTLQGESIRVAGKVSDDPIHWDVRNLSLAFVMGEGQARIPVRYQGVKPDMFQMGVDVIVEGRIGHDGVLAASVLMTSCPSKYQEEKSPTL
jgi:cytochrome c-type biogenesis protein CcmE